MSRVPIRRWVGMLVLGELIKSAVLVMMGYWYAAAIQQVSSSIQVLLWVLTAVILIAGLIWYKLRQKRHLPT